MLLDQLSSTSSVTATLEHFYNEEIHYSALVNNNQYNLKPSEMIALQTDNLLAYRRSGFLRGKSGRVYAKVESITLADMLNLDMNNDIPLGKLLKPYGYTRENLYAKAVNDHDEAGNGIIFRIHARLHTDRPISLVREWIYGMEKPSLDKPDDIQ